jgi:hypothetical protein
LILKIPAKINDSMISIPIHIKFESIAQTQKIGQMLQELLTKEVQVVFETVESFIIRFK